MEGRRYCPPNAEAMERLLKRYQFEPTGVVLALAWCEGLTRKEICALTWDEVDFDAMLLRLPDRQIPLEENVAELLRRWNKRYARFSQYVAFSDRLRTHLVPGSITHMARVALDSEGMMEVRLQDLRYDYVRRQFESHDWPYVLRVAGLSVSTYRSGLHLENSAESAAKPEKPDDIGEDLKLWRVMQADRDTPAGIALWLTTQLGMQTEEMISLTWDQVDFAEGKIVLPNRELVMTSSVRHVLEDAYAKREPEDDPHVFLTERSRRPMDPTWLSVLARTALIRGGIENKSLSDFRRDPEREIANRKILAYAAEHGSITRIQTMEMLGLSKGQAYSRLTALRESGELLLINSKYYPADKAVHPEHQTEAVRNYLRENGNASRQDIVNLLHIGERTTAKLLKRMVNSGEIVLLRPTRQYTLPKEDHMVVEFPAVRDGEAERPRKNNPKQTTAEI